jgi:fused signal recognition particle receptor
MSDCKKAGLFQRLLGIGDRPAEPTKKDPPQDSPKRDRPAEVPKKDPPADRPPQKEPPVRKEAKAAVEPKRSWFDQLRHGLARTSTALSDNLAGALTKRKLDEDTLDRIEEVLIKADLGVAMAARIRAAIAKGRYDRGLDTDAVRDIVAAEIAAVLEPVTSDFTLSAEARPHVFLVVGVNGTGKTTTAAKMAHQFKRNGSSVMLAAADTFRAAAIDQLKVWGARVGAEVVSKEVGADPAGVAFEALERARAEGMDVLLIDTAGRLQNKSDLMAELAKIVRVLKKIDPAAPHGVILVLDATTGQNAIAQVEIFREIAGVTALVVTKLDGTARGGVLVAIAERFKLPIAAIGVGEGLDDLKPFTAQDFARAIAGAKSENEAAA